LKQLIEQAGGAAAGAGVGIATAGVTHDGNHCTGPSGVASGGSIR